MKKYGTIMVLILAVVSGIGAVTLVHRWLSSHASEGTVIIKDSVPMSRIVIASKDIPVGSFLTADNLAMAEWPKTTVLKGSFDSIEDLEGRVAVTRLNAGQPVLNAELAAPGSGAGLVAVIEPGYRAMSIKVNEVVGVGGFVLPDTYVDVISVTGSGNSKRSVKTILERIKVLAIAQETFTEGGTPKVVKTVTLEVTPEAAEELALKTHQGDIHLVLRNPNDEIEEVAVAPPPPPPAPKPVAGKWVPVLKPRIRALEPEPFAVEVIRGSKPKELVTFQDASSEDKI
jgi:pilus assembly protein CpaB